MCIIFFAFQQVDGVPLIIAANRDEYHSRPTAPLAYWQPNEKTDGILAGRDLVAGGTWLGINKTGKLAALTNHRDPVRSNRQWNRSRGDLVTAYLTSTLTADEFHLELSNNRHRYDGYNLLFGDSSKLYHYHSVEDQLTRLAPGIYGLSNATLNTPWPKVTTGINQLRRMVDSAIPSHLDLFGLLENTQRADLTLLPNTGISQAREHQLSAIHIEGDDYGTRSATVITAQETDAGLLFRVTERCYERAISDTSRKLVKQACFNLNINQSIIQI